jgi:diguanylate cyclase (GGDEF)-like protein
MRLSLPRSIANNPWTSAQDAILAVSVLAAGLLLAIEFDLFHFAHELSVEEQRISLLEAIALTVLLALCIVAFVLRRVREEQIETEKRAEIDVAMRELRNQAMHDELTGLPNRRAMFSRLKELDPKGDGRQHAFFLLDLDGFKSVNDQRGHAAGDNVLLVVAERFKRVARPTDLLARLGGDEFAVLAHDVDYDGAKAAGHRFIAALDNKIWVDGVGHEIGVSIGAVLIPRDCTAVEAILGDADIAMYRAKAARGSALVFYCDLDQHGSLASGSSG